MCSVHLKCLYDTTAGTRVSSQTSDFQVYVSCVQKCGYLPVAGRCMMMQEDAGSVFWLKTLTAELIFVCKSFTICRSGLLVGLN